MPENSTLFILEEPYISNLMLKTLEKNRFSVLNNDLAKKAGQEYNLHLVDKKDTNNYTKIYSNSENSVSIVQDELNIENIKNFICVCKDKAEMRKQLHTIYPDFYFKEITLEELNKTDYSILPPEFIIKPAVGFLSMGVHKVTSEREWDETKSLIKKEINDFEKNFPASVLNSSKFIIEEIIKGEEFAIDAYFNTKGEVVILNIFKHPFVSENDVSDRAYISSKEIIENNIKPFEKILNAIGTSLGFFNFPVHIEVIKKADGEVVPVEINPMRFAGWCTTDLAYYAYGINVYEYFSQDKKPNWEKILENKSGKTYYFAMAETPTGIDKSKITFDYEMLKKSFSKILDFREIDFLTRPVFAVIFGETSSNDEITKILELDMRDYIKGKSLVLFSYLTLQK